MSQPAPYQLRAMGNSGFYGAPALGACVRNGCQGFRDGTHLFSPACCLKMPIRTWRVFVHHKLPQLSVCGLKGFEALLFYTVNLRFGNKKAHIP